VTDLTVISSVDIVALASDTAKCPNVSVKVEGSDIGSSSSELSDTSYDLEELYHRIDGYQYHCPCEKEASDSAYEQLIES